MVPLLYGKAPSKDWVLAFCIHHPFCDCCGGLFFLAVREDRSQPKNNAHNSRSHDSSSSSSSRSTRFFSFQVLRESAKRCHSKNVSVPIRTEATTTTTNMKINTLFYLCLFLPFLMSPTGTQAFVSVLRRNTRTSSVVFFKTTNDTSEFAHHLPPPLGLFPNDKKEILDSLKRLEDDVKSMKVSLAKVENDVDWIKTLGTAAIGVFAAAFAAAFATPVVFVLTNKGVLISVLEALTKK